MSKFRKAIISILISLLTLGFGTCVNASSLDFTVFQEANVGIYNAVGASQTTSRNYDYGELIYNEGASDFVVKVKGNVSYTVLGNKIQFRNYTYNPVYVTCTFYRNSKMYKTIRVSVPARKMAAKVTPEWTYKIINVGDTVSLHVSSNVNWSITNTQGAITAYRSGNTITITGNSVGYGFFSVYASGVQSTLIGVTVKRQNIEFTPSIQFTPTDDTGSSSTSSGSGGTTYVSPADTTAPTCTISANKTSPTNASQITYTIRFSESVTGFDQSDISINKGSIASFSGSGSSYTAVVNTDESEYTQTFAIAAGKCTDSAGNANTASNTVSIDVDRVVPKFEFISATTDNAINAGYASKDNSVTVKFKVTDNKFKNSTLVADDIEIYAGDGKLSVGSENLALTSTNITNGVEYTLVIKNLTGDGKLKLIIPASKAFDTAGNGNVATDSSTSASDLVNIVIDNTKPEVESASISGVNEHGYIKNGETATLKIKFTEALNKAPIVKIDGVDAKVEGSSADYTATITIPEDEAELTEGELSIEISDYSDFVGLVGDTVTKTTDGSKLIYDRTAPKAESITPNGNTTWAKKQSTIISVSDNFTAKKDITGKYSWILLDAGVSGLANDFINEAEISKDTETGKFRIYLQVQDLAGNIGTIVTNPFYIDNSVTEVGRVKITKDTENGEVYTTHEVEAKNEEGGYTSDCLYIRKVDGKDDESGHKKTVYQVERILDDGTLVSVGEKTIEDTRIEKDGNYKITVTTWDNLDNVDYRYYIIHKGSTNVVFEPNGNTEYEVEVSTKVTVDDTLGLTDKIYYEWAKKEDGQPDVIDNEIQNGDTAKLTDVEGEYILYVKVVDKDGNETIAKSEVFYVAGKITNMGQMLFKENDVEGKDYEPDTFTKENIYMKIKDHGNDEHGGEVVSTYTVIKLSEGEETVVGKYTNESTVLTKDGKYKVILTSTSELGASTSQEFIIKIDKIAPTIEFNGLEDYQTTGSINVAITDEGIAASGLDLNGLKYYWTRSTEEPKAEDFEGETNEFRGSIESANATIKAPKNVSGIWYLWALAKDNVGNISIKSNVKIENDGNISYVDNEAPVAGTLVLKENDKDGNDYTPDTFTKENIYINLLNGYDADSGVKSNVYSVYKNGSIIKSNLTEETTLTEHGVYTAIVTTVDNSQNKATREYKIKIDKNGPTIELIPDGNMNYAKVQEVTLKITELSDESGVNSEKTEAYWFSYNINRYESIQDAWKALQEVVQDKAVEEVQESLSEAGLCFVSVTIENNKVKTPDNQTGIYYLYVYAEDMVGNKNAKLSTQGYAIDNTKPTKPQISAKKIEENQRETNYYGELTNCDVKVVAKGSIAESGVDNYEYSISTDEGKTWSNYQDATITKDGEIQGEVIISQEGTTLIKMRAIAKLEDGQNESEETEIITIRIDKTGPKVTFANHQNGENGSQNMVESIQVRATVTDDGIGQINKNTLRYEWIKFQSVEDYQSFDKSSKDISTLKGKMTENQKVFANGEELPSPEGAEGIYSMFVYAQDALGNETVEYSNYYYLGSLIKEGDYEIQNNYILRVLPETKLSDFVSKIKNQIKGNTYQVYNKEGKEIEQNEYVTTKSTITIDQKQYKIIVVGDLNGDGKLDLQDVSIMQYHVAQIKELQGEYKLAADINYDQNVDMIDLARVLQIIAGIREI